MANRLSGATSPYLLQHADNPVDWWEWGDDAFAEARRRGVPVFLSVGYAACHWCHVMAHESFEDDATAGVMNELFVNIKVDREERPDIDQIYMAALHHLGEHGGWPLTMFLTPDGEPFWGGTYFPKTSRYGKPAFVDLLREVERVFRQDPQSVEQNRSALMARLAQSALPKGRVVIAAPELERSANELFRQRARETVGWLAREMTTPEGAFCASLDADSEGEEGKFYVWSLAEITAVLGEDDAAFFAAHYDVTPGGNFEGHNILNRLKYLPRSMDDEKKLARMREELLATRAKRVRPGLDDKVLADWNGLMLAALVNAGLVFE